jgi:hypothetical protein
MKKSVSITLLVIILLQSCAVYNTQRPIYLYQATYSGKARVVYKSGEDYKYDFISSEGNNYFGVKGKNITQLDSAQIRSVYLKKKNKSISPADGVAGGVIIVVLIAGAALVVWGVIAFINFVDNL